MMTEWHHSDAKDHILERIETAKNFVRMVLQGSPKICGWATGLYLQCERVTKTKSKMRQCSFFVIRSHRVSSAMNKTSVTIVIVRATHTCCAHSHRSIINAPKQGLQTTARGLNPARKAISSGPQRHLSIMKNKTYLQKMF